MESQDAKGYFGPDSVCVGSDLLSFKKVSTPTGNVFKGTLLGTPNREPQEYSRNIMEYKDPGIYLLYTYYILGVPYLGFPVESL